MGDPVEKNIEDLRLQVYVGISVYILDDVFYINTWKL